MAKTTVLAAVAILLALIYRYVIYPAFLSPLSRIPNAHPTASLSPLWISWKRLYFGENRAIYAAHERHGAVIRLGPNELHVNCVDNGLRTIYAGGYEKHDWYHLFANYDGVPTMFSTVESKPHSQKKRMMSNIYAKSTIQSSKGFAISCQRIMHERLLPLIHSKASQVESRGAIDLYQLLNFATMDIVTAYMFGLKSSSNFIQDEMAGNWWLELYQSRKKFTFWPQENPRLTAFMQKCGIHLSPKWVAEANNKLEDWCMRMCDRAGECAISMDKISEDGQPQDIPNVHRQLRTSLKPEESRNGTKHTVSSSISQDSRFTIASEMLDQLSAGHETSAITLTYLFHELCLIPALQESLRSELHSSHPNLKYDSTKAADQQPRLPALKDLDTLPLLHAIIMETLRLHPAIPGPEPRISPSSTTTTLGPYTDIPPNVRVSSSPYSLHRNAAVFPSPLSFEPSRWLPPKTPEEEERQKEQHRWFWAFSSGGRMCIGSNLAMAQMKLIVAVLVANFKFGEVLDEGGEGGMWQEDAYTAGPQGAKLVVAVEVV